MLKRRILYFICLAVVFGINIFYVEYQIFILLVLMIAIPLVSWIMYAISDVSLGLSLQVNKNVVQVGNRIKIRIVKKNACNLAFVNGSITIKYMYCHTGDEFMINVPIKQGIRKSAGITDISADYCGNICVGVESIEICDYLGLFGKKKQFAGVTKVSVMPEETTDRYMEADRANAYYDEENEVYVKSASDEVSELREYRDGDSPRNIHWKRSSILAENDFIVKEYSTNINKTVFIVVDTDWRGEKSWRLSRMSRIYAEMMSQGLACAEAGLTGQYIVWDMAKADIVRVTFYDNASLKAAVKVVMDIRCGEGTVNKACQALYEDDRLEITIKYMYCHTGDEFMINVPIKQGIRKSAGITDISADYCGNICVGVESIEICDYLGLFGKKKQFAGVTKVSVMPEETTDRYMEADRANAYYDEENEVYVKSASDEVSELREYRDGDSPRNIHWKRSSILAENDFIVKEYSTNINKTVFIVVDTDWRGEKSWRLSRMSRIYAEMMSQGLACAEAGLTGQYIVWDMAKADIVRVTFYDNASLKAAVKVVMDIRCGEGTVNKACQALYEDDRLEITTEPVIITEN